VRSSDPTLTPRIALRPKEAAEALGVSDRTLRKWMKDEDLPFLRVAGVVLVPTAGLEEWLVERATREHRADELADEIVDGILNTVDKSN